MILLEKRDSRFISKSKFWLSSLSKPSVTNNNVWFCVSNLLDQLKLKSLIELVIFVPAAQSFTNFPTLSIETSWYLSSGVSWI